MLPNATSEMVSGDTQPLVMHIQSVPELLNTDPITTDYQETHLHSGVLFQRK